jgi:hypothetical protein
MTLTKQQGFASILSTSEAEMAKLDGKQQVLLMDKCRVPIQQPVIGPNV